MSLPPILSSTLRHPVVAAPMFIVSTPELVIAQCKAGIVGSFPALNARKEGELSLWLDRIISELAAHDRLHPEAKAAPFAVNQIVHRSNERLDTDLAICREHRVPITITSGGLRPEVIDLIHGHGGIVLHDIINDMFARKAATRGADGLIAVAAGAGGHAGTASPFALIQEIRDWFDGPLLLSGAIASGASILAALALGADLAYIGSAFIATREANAVAAYKDMVMSGSSADIVYTNHFSGVHGNYLKPSIAQAGLDPDNLPSGDQKVANFGSDRQRPKAWKDIWGCGQGIGVVKEALSTADFIDKLKTEFDEAAARLNGKLSGR